MTYTCYGSRCPATDISTLVATTTSSIRTTAVNVELAHAAVSPATRLQLVSPHSSHRKQMRLLKTLFIPDLPGNVP